MLPFQAVAPALLLLLPGFAALDSDHPSFALDPLPGPLAPGTGVGRVNATVTLPCTDAWRDASVRFSIQGELPTWLRANLSPPEGRLAPADCVGATQARITSVVEVRVAEHAPALQETVVRVAALLRGSEGEREAVADLRVQAAYVGRIRVETPEASKTAAAGATVTFPLRVANLGNHHARLVVEVVDNPHAHTVVLPPPRVVESAAAGGDETEVTINVQVRLGEEPGRASDVTLRVIPTYVYDAKVKGEAQTVKLRVETEKVLLPGPAPLVVLGVGMLVALGGRRALLR